MKPYEKIVHEYRSKRPGNYRIVTLLLDPESGEFKVRQFHTSYKGWRKTASVWGLSEFLKLKDPRWPRMYTLPQLKVRNAVLDLMIAGGAEEVEDIHAYRT